MMLPVTIGLAGGGTKQLFPKRALAAIATSPTESCVWQYDSDGMIEEILVRAEVQDLLAVLGLDDDD